MYQLHECLPLHLNEMQALSKTLQKNFALTVAADVSCSSNATRQMRTRYSRCATYRAEECG